MNNKGFTLIECLAVMAIIGILTMTFTTMLTASNKQIARLNKAILLAQDTSVKKPATVMNRLVKVDTTCQYLDGSYYGYTTDNNTLRIYTDAKCKVGFGTLDRLTNETWFNEATKSMWFVFYGSSLKVFVVQYN